MKTLTAAQVKSLKEPGLHRAGVGLYLSVKSSGRRSWIQRVLINGKRRDIGLGGYPDISLAQAREQNARNRIDIADGLDPLALKRRLTTPTFRKAAESTHASLAPTWRSQQHAERWMRTLKKHAMPSLGDIPVGQITKHDVLSVLEPIWHSRPETAKRIRWRIRAVLRYCQAHDYVDGNVADERINGALPKNTTVKKNLRAMPYQDLPEVWKLIDEKLESVPGRLCLRWTILTAARSGEARGARWSEIDLENNIWSVPGERMKGGKPHRVPLSNAALDVLEEAKPLRDQFSDLVFPSPMKRGYPLSDMTLMMKLRRLGLAERTVVHGFRSSFRTYALEKTEFPWEVCEAALAHELGSQVARSYARSDLLERRRPLMQLWSDFLEDSDNG